MSDPIITPPTKRCTNCGNEYPATTEHFYAKKGVKSGLTAHCRECVKAHAADYRAKHGEEHRAASRNYYYEHKEQCLARSAKWQRENPDKLRASVKKWMATKPDYARDYARRYYREHHDKVLDQKRRWRAANPDVARAQWQRRYARKKAAAGSATAADLAAIRAAQTDSEGHLNCWICGKPIKRNPHLDHWIPLQEDGTHNPGNLHYTHQWCNQSKGGKHPTEIGRLL
jgi:hypothetical protein